MSDTFDPDAWPHTPSTAGPRPEANADEDDFPRRVDDDDDDYDPLAIDAPKAAYGEDNDDYAADTYDYDYDEPTTTTPRAVDDEDDGTYSSYDTYDDDDDTYNDYDDFGGDDQNGSGGGIRKLLIPIAVVVVVLLLVVVGASLLGGKKSNKVATKTTTTSKAQAQTSDTAISGASVPLPDDVTTDLNQALSAWGQFAVDGNLDDVRPYFVNSGSQFTHFQTEAPNIAAKPPGGAPLSMSMTNAKSLNPDANTWVIQGTVVVTRTGEKQQNFPWEIRMTRQNAQQPWQVLTVRQWQ